MQEIDIREEKHVLLLYLSLIHISSSLCKGTICIFTICSRASTFTKFTVNGYYPVRICMAELCVQLRQFVYYMHVNKKTGCLLHKNFLAALIPETFLLSVICCLLFQFKCLQCGFLSPVSCTDKAIHAFSNKTQRPLVVKYFLLSFNGTPHPLGY